MEGPPYYKEYSVKSHCNKLVGTLILLCYKESLLYQCIQRVENWDKCVITRDSLFVITRLHCISNVPTTASQAFKRKGVV